MSASVQDLIPELQQPAQELVNLAGRAGVQPRVTSTFRTSSQQKRLYAAFLRGETHYPVAPPGSSAHEYGFAFDLVAATQVDLHDLGQVWTSWGGIWSPNDEVHFEYPGFSPPSPAIAAGDEEPGFWEQLIAGLPFALWPSILLGILGIPTTARAINSRQEAKLRQIVHDAHL